MPNARATIERLREDIRHIEGRRPVATSVIPTGCARIDALLPGGGLPRGTISELIGGRASGKTAVALAAVVRALQSERAVAAFVDGRRELYPPAVAASGIPLERLLVVRPDGVGPVATCKSALWAAEAVLSSRAFEAVVVDVPVEILAGDRGSAGAVDGMLRRIRSAAEKGGGLAVWLALPGGPRVSSGVRLDLSAFGAVRAIHAA